MDTHFPTRTAAVGLTALATTAVIVWSVAGLAGNDDTPTTATTTATMPSTGAPNSPAPSPAGPSTTATPVAPTTEPIPVPDTAPPAINPGTARPRQPLPTPGSAAGASAIARACVIRTYSVDTRVDTTRRDAAARCSRYATPAYAAALDDGAVRTDSEWEAWVADGVYTTVEATPIPSPGQDVTDTRLISWRLTITAHQRGGATSTLDPIDIAVAIAPGQGDAARVEGILLL